MKQPCHGSRRVGPTPHNLYLISINDSRKCIFQDLNFTSEPEYRSYLQIVWPDLVTVSEKMGHLYYLFLILHIVFLSSEILNITGPVSLAILYHIAAEKSYK